MKFRPATSSDLSSIVDINLRSIFETCSSHYTESDLKQWIGDRSEKNFEKSLSGNQLFVVEDEKRITGFLDVVPGEVLAVYVYPEEERKGYGRKLLLEGIQRAKKENEEVVVFASLNAVSFYEKYGFEKGEEVKHSRNDIDLPLIKMTYTKNSNKTCERNAEIAPLTRHPST